MRTFITVELLDNRIESFLCLTSELHTDELPHFELHTD